MSTCETTKVMSCLRCPHYNKMEHLWLTATVVASNNTLSNTGGSPVHVQICAADTPPLLACGVQPHLAHQHDQAWSAKPDQVSSTDLACAVAWEHTVTMVCINAHCMQCSCLLVHVHGLSCTNTHAGCALQVNLATCQLIQYLQFT